jgi:hypothetical protein
MWVRWSNLVLSVWLVVAPFLLHFNLPAARTNTVIVGLCLFLFALVAEAIPAFRFLDTALGLWLIASPFLLGYGHVGYGDEWAPAVNSVVVGILVAALSLVPVRWTNLRSRAIHT